MAIRKLLAVDPAHLRRDDAVPGPEDHQHGQVQTGEAALQLLVPVGSGETPYEGLLLGGHGRVEALHRWLALGMGVQQAHPLLSGHLRPAEALRSDRGRSRQHQGLQPSGRLHGEPERKAATERVAHQREALDAEVGDRLSHAGGQVRQGSRSLVRRGVTEAGDLQGDDAKAFGEQLVRA
jgi:hypothetical protein